MKRIIYLTAATLLVVFVVLTVLKTVGKSQSRQYTFGKVERADIINTVSSSGTINAVRTVEVGTQVSGIINYLYVDFNDRVRQGQLLAVLDTLVLKTALMDAEANREKAVALLEQATSEYNRNVPLFEKQLISEAEFLPIRIDVKTAQANLKSVQAAYDRAARNLKYAFIYSPISGTVIQRNVEEGQTVAASLQAPVLFIIAEDLSKMEIHALVDESDIGEISEGQQVTFDVQAYPDRLFEGIVKQIRLQPTTVQNVVNYTVVIDAANLDNLLLPGMTATVDFIIEKREQVLTVPNAALRYEPSPDAASAKMPAPPAQAGNPSNPSGAASPMPDASRRENTGTMPANRGRVWYMDENQQLAMALIKTGATNGKITEIIESRHLREGQEVIISAQLDEEASKNGRTQQNFGPPRPF